jgi:hypothetical protein
VVIRIFAVLFFVCCFFAACGGHFGEPCPNDDSIIAWFHANKNTLEDLLSMIATDGENVTYVGRGIVKTSPGTSLPVARKQEYLRKFGQTRADSLGYTRNERANVGLWTDAVSITVPSRYKGIEYIDINKWRYKERLRPSLDGLEKNGEKGIWLRHIEGKWYIVYTNG